MPSCRPKQKFVVMLLVGLMALGLAVTSSLSAAAGNLELVMFVEPGCPWCARWDREVGPGYGKSEEGRRAPLRRIDVSEARRSGLALKTAVTVTPTFVLVDGERELGRITGYPGADFFWGLLDELMARASPAPQRGPMPRDAGSTPPGAPSTIFVKDGS